MAKKQRKFSFKPEKIITPVGALWWCFVQGDGRDQSEAEDGSKMQKLASIRFKTDSPECIALKKQIDAAWDRFKAENTGILKKGDVPKSLGYKVITNEEKEDTDETGFFFKTNSFFPNGKPNNIGLFDKKGNPLDLDEDTFIGNGSMGKIHGTIDAYEFKNSYGMTIYLKGIQIGKLIKSTSGDISGDLSDMSDMFSDDDDEDYSTPNTMDDDDIPF